ncbi:hypothetical protein Hanom_Chr14g01292121 [Helianthus anomalus]
MCKGCAWCACVHLFFFETFTTDGKAAHYHIGSYHRPTPATKTYVVLTGPALGALEFG